MKEKIQFEIDYLEFEIKNLRERLNNEVESFKVWLNEYGDAETISCIPSTSQFQAIQSDVIKLRNMDDKKRWLLHLIKGG